MKPSWKNKLSKIIPLAALVGVVLFVMSTHFAHALAAGECFSWGDGFSLSACIGGFFYGVIYFMSTIFGILFAFILWVIEIILQFNMNVVNTTFVQIGFSVTLGLANLGFVLGIIIVALATILRRETYGVKSILWKLIVMAILVNFALVIAAPIISFGNNLTIFFVNGMSGSSGTNSATQLNPFDNFAGGIAGVFQPQRFVSPENASTSVGTVTLSATSWIGTLIGGIVGSLMSLIALVAMCIILIVLFIMLLIRYVYLEVLLVIAPLAWMAWIFPGTSKHFSKWWDRFIKQVFFPAIAMFFIYLVVKIGGDISAGQNVSAIPLPGNWFNGFLQALGFGVIGNTIAAFANAAIMIGLMMAGLTMASSLSTEGSKLATQAVAKVRDGVTGYAMKRGKKGARAVGRGLGVDKAIQNARTGQLGKDMRGKKLFGIPGTGFVGTAAGYVAGKLPKGPVSAAARAASEYMTNADLVEEAKKNVPKDSAMVEKDLAGGTLKKEEIFAWFASRMKDGLMKPGDMIGKQTAEEYVRTHGDDFSAYGQGKLKYDYGILTNETDNTREANDVIEKAKAAGNTKPEDVSVKVQKDIKDQLGNVVFAVDSMQKASDVLAASYREMAQSWTKDMAAKTDVNSMSPDKLKQILGAFSIYAPALIPPLLKKAKSPALTRIELVYQDAIRGKALKIPGELAAEKAAIMKSDKLTDGQKAESGQQMDALMQFVVERVKKLGSKGGPDKVIENALAANVMFFGGQDFGQEPEEKAAPTAPKPPTPKP